MMRTPLLLAAFTLAAVACAGDDFRPLFNGKDLKGWQTEGNWMVEKDGVVAPYKPAAWNDTLAKLYRAARRSGLRADDIIDALIEALPTSDGSGGHERSFLRLTRRLPEEVQ